MAMRVTAGRVWLVACACGGRSAGSATRAGGRRAGHRHRDRRRGRGRCRARPSSRRASSIRRRRGRPCPTRAGVYTLAGLAPGVYRIDVDAHRLPAGAPRRRSPRDRRDDPAGRRARGRRRQRVVTVTADAPLQRATASLGQVVSEEKVAALPLNGRSFITLAALAPGVALPPGVAVAAHQRRPAAHQRVPVRRHLGAAARAGPGRLLSDRSTRSRSSRSKPTARRPSSAASTAASST